VPRPEAKQAVVAKGLHEQPFRFAAGNSYSTTIVWRFRAKDFDVGLMSPDENKQEVDRLKQLNDELSTSLKRCRRLLHDYEVRLTANSNEAERPDAADESREA